MAVTSSEPAGLAPERLGAEIAANRYRAVALALASALVVAVILGVATGAAGGPLVGLGVGVGVVLVLTAAMWWGSGPLALALMGARPASPVDQPRAHNLLDSLCAGAGALKPALAVLDHPSVDALLVGRSPSRVTVVTTSGLLSGLSLLEIEAVLADLVVRAKANQACPATVAVTALGPVAVLVPRLAGLPARVVQRGATAAGWGGEGTADLAAVALTRYPPAMVSALEKVMKRSPPSAPSPALARAVEHLWTPRPQVEERIRALREL